jgi:cob(I)alamin adenosyltransferase
MARDSENPVVLSRIYTRTGDDGTTALGDGSRTAKTDSRLAAYADVDEANCAIGVALSFGELPDDIAALLVRVQNELFDVGADLATPVRPEPPPYPPLRIDEAYITRLESECDSYNDPLPTLRSFLLPGGSPGSTLLHVARTVTRRAERSAWAAAGEHGDSVSPLPARYLNRLSDLLFILSRVANAGHGDVLWKPGGDRGLGVSQGHVQVGAGGRGLQPGQQAGEGRLGQGQVDGTVRAELALGHDAARSENGDLLRGGRPARHHGQVAAGEGLLRTHPEAEDAVPAELVELVGGDAQAP